MVWGIKYQRKRTLVVFVVVATGLLLNTIFPLNVGAQQQSQSDSVGIEAVIPSEPPKTAPVISVPRNGQTFTTTPITVSGLCTGDYLVEVFKNNVFAGSTTCRNGSYSLQIDLFDGQNDLVARHYDALNQAGPDSNVVTVTFNSALPSAGARPVLTTAYAKRGADPGSVLTWPITLSGGTGPFAISVDWGDDSPLDLISRQAGGTFNLEHTYLQAGVYNIVIKVTDSNGSAAFLQLVGIANGPIQQSTAATQGGDGPTIERVILWWPFLITLFLSVFAFWLGKKHQLQTIRDRLHRGERPI